MKCRLFTILTALSVLPARDALARANVQAPHGRPPLNYPALKRPFRDWFWPVLYVLIVVGAIVLVMYLQLTGFFAGMGDFE
jgi:hypothetical protein